MGAGAWRGPDGVLACRRQGVAVAVAEFCGGPHDPERKVNILAWGAGRLRAARRAHVSTLWLECFAAPTTTQVI